MVAGVQGSYLSLAVFCVQFLGILQNVGGTGHIDVHFLEYFDACREELPSDKCDPMFTFCLSTPQKGRLNVEGCTYESTGQSADVFGGTNHINMEPLTNIGGIKNPWSVLVQKFNEPSIMLIVRVYDADLFTKDDHMQTWGKTLTETVWPDQDHAKWEERIMSQNAFTMRFKIRMYCDPYYYTTACDKYCKSEDSSSGHYTCDANGDKICRPGWTGSQCNEDIDECALGFCVRGTCTNTPGDYTCNCPENYTGKNCSYLKNPCREQPCGNGGTCFAHSSEHIYVCQCMPEWDGTNCQLRKPTVCVNNPCLNNGTCSSSTDKTKYTCTCFGPFTGDNCEIAVTTVQSNNETDTTPAFPTGLDSTSPEQTTSAEQTTSTDKSPTVRHDFECHLSYMQVFIPVALVPNSELTLRDPTCKLNNNGTHHKITFAYDECDTTKTSYEDYIDIKNDISVHTILNGTDVITFVEDYKIPLLCSVDRSKMLNSALLVVPRENIAERVQQSSDFTLKEYTSADYSQEITDYPVQVPLNREIFFEITLKNNSNSSIGVYVEQCQATPSPNPNDTTHIALIDLGCPAHPAVNVQPSAEIDHFRFSTQAFRFSAQSSVNSLVYIHCSVSTCGGETCKHSCSSRSRRRRRRSARNLASTILTSGSHVVTNDAK